MLLNFDRLIGNTPTKFGAVARSSDAGTYLGGIFLLPGFSYHFYTKRIINRAPNKIMTRNFDETKIDDRNMMVSITSNNDAIMAIYDITFDVLVLPVLKKSQQEAGFQQNITQFRDCRQILFLILSEFNPFMHVVKWPNIL